LSSASFAWPRSTAQRWLYRLWPSSRLRRDPLSDLRVADRYAPVSIANWKLTPVMRRHVLAHRVPLPLTFEPERRLAVIIPFRDREGHLCALLPVLTATLRQQQLRFRIIVVEQEPGSLFNRGRLINTGMLYAAEFSDYYCLHDVDALPVVANYACPSQPLRLVSKIVAANDGHEARRTGYYFSGAVSIRKEQAFAANGYSNEYWGWGKEDDDLFFRLLLAGYLCYYDTLGTFEDLPNPGHQQVVRRSPATPPYVRYNRERRSRLVRGLMNPVEDGLSTLRYTIVGRAQHEDYERILVRW